MYPEKFQGSIEAWLIGGCKIKIYIFELWLPKSKARTGGKSVDKASQSSF